MEEGLPHNTVVALAQTRDGYLWVGTTDGLARFDGVQFKRFGLADGLPSPCMRALLEDRSGALWIGTTNGLCRYSEGRFTSWTARDGLAGNMVLSLAEDGEGAIWVATTTGLGRWHKGRLETMGEASGIASRYVAAIAADEAGALWASVTGIGLLRHENGVFTSAGVPSENSPGNPMRMMRDRSGRIWAGTVGAVHCLEKGRWRAFGPSDGLSRVAVTSLVEGADGALWAGTLDDGLFCLRGESFVRFAEEDGLPEEGILATLEDREGNLWVGTRSEGLSRLRRRQAFLWRHSDEGAAIAPKSLAQAPDGTIWVTSYGRGLYRFDPEAKEAFVRQTLPKLPNALSSGALLSGRDGSLWWGGGASLARWKNGRLIAYNARIVELPDDAVTCLCEDREDGGMWIGSRRGRVLLQRNGRITRFSDGLPRGILMSLVQQADGTLWIGSYGGGLGRLQGGKGRTFGREQGLSSELVRALLLDSRGTLWIGTEGGGLNCLHNGVVRTFGSLHGIEEDSIVALAEDAAGDLWLGTFRGIVRLLRSDLDGLLAGRLSRVYPRKFDRGDGLLSAQCATGFGTALATRSGLLLFSTERGLVSIDPAELTAGASAPEVRLEALFVGGRPSPFGTSVEIPPGARQLQIDYTALHFTAPEHVRFRYRLAGLEADWIEAGPRRSVQYSYLPPGKYRFDVAAHTGDGKWSAKPAGLTLFVQPHPWETWWFRTLVWLAGVGLTAGIGIALLRRRHRLRLQALEHQQAVERERTRIARDMHDALGSRLTKAGMIAEAICHDAGTASSPAPQNLSALRRSLEEITVTMDELVWAVNPRHDTLDSLANYLIRFTQEFFAATSIRCELLIPTDLPAVPLTASVRHNLFLSYQEALSNAARHARPSVVTVRLGIGGERLLLEVIDDGAGFDPTVGRPGGRGLDNMRTRLLAIGGRCDIASQPNRGTCVRLELRWPPSPHVHGDTQTETKVL